MKNICVFLLVTSFLLIGAFPALAADTVVRSGSHVAFDYSLIVDGNVVDSSEGRKPLEYTQGDGKLLPGLTKQMEGLKTGDERTIEVKPEDGYGIPDPAAVKEVPLAQLPADPKPQVGMMLQGRDKDGNIFPARIIQIKDDVATVDLNHPLAGKTLVFRIKIVDVK